MYKNKTDWQNIILLESEFNAWKSTDDDDNDQSK